MQVRCLGVTRESHTVAPCVYLGSMWQDSMLLAHIVGVVYGNDCPTCLQVVGMQTQQQRLAHPKN